MSAYTYRHLTRVEAIDGDTIRTSIDLGFRMTKRIDVRLDGIDTPEIHRGSELHRKAGRLAAQAAAAWLAAQPITDLAMHSYRLDKYAGRVVGDIDRIHDDPTDGPVTLSGYLRKAGFAKRTNPDGSRQPWTDAELSAITGTPQKTQ